MQKTKLVLLPGLDGTGRLFAPLIAALPGRETCIIPLPSTGPQDYDALAAHVRARLPAPPYAIVAESFSGPIAAQLALTEGKDIAHVFFVATFLSTPAPFLLRLARVLPVPLLARLPFAGAAVRALFLGCGAGEDVVSLFLGTVRELPGQLVRARLRALLDFKWSGALRTGVPCTYIEAQRDLFVGAKHAGEYAAAFPGIAHRTADGPHFILQAAPVSCAEIIGETPGLS